LIRTPEVKNEIFNNVYEFLSSFPGEIEFVKSVNQFYKSDFEKVGLTDFYESYYLNKPIEVLYSSPGEEPIFSNLHSPHMRDFLKLTKIYRERIGIDDKSIVIILTEINAVREYENWNWDMNFGILTTKISGDFIEFKEVHYKLSLAHELTSMILRIKMKLRPRHSFHKKPCGCINDYLFGIKDLPIKLRTADICDECCDIIDREKISDKLITHILDILDGIRTQLLFRMKFNRRIQAVSISVNENNKILLPTLGNLEIKLTPLFKTLFIFYLNHTEGISFSDLAKYKDELNKLYRKLNKRIPDKEIGLTIDMVLNKDTDFFSINKSRLNSAITKQLGEPLASFYKISGKPREAFKINVPKELITIHTNTLSAFRNQV